jgi:hypothetical protein
MIKRESLYSEPQKLRVIFGKKELIKVVIANSLSLVMEQIIQLQPTKKLLVWQKIGVFK